MHSSASPKLDFWDACSYGMTYIHTQLPVASLAQGKTSVILAVFITIYFTTRCGSDGMKSECHCGSHERW